MLLLLLLLIAFIQRYSPLSSRLTALPCDSTWASSFFSHRVFECPPKWCTYSAVSGWTRDIHSGIVSVWFVGPMSGGTQDTHSDIVSRMDRAAGTLMEMQSPLLAPAVINFWIRFLFTCMWIPAQYRTPYWARGPDSRNHFPQTSGFHVRAVKQ